MKTLRLFLIAAVAAVVSSAAGAQEARWWEAFGDATLDSLMESTERGNLQVAGQWRTLQAARMALNGTRSAYYPTLDLSAGWTAAQSSGQTTARHAETAEVDYFSAGLALSWEIDVFGRVAAQVKSGKAQVAVSMADYDGILLSVRAEMAKAYFSYLLAQNRREVVADQLASQREILHITEVRKETGLSSGLDVAQARTTVLSTQAMLPAIEASEKSALHSIAMLQGKQGAVAELANTVGGVKPLPPLPEVIPGEIPLDLVSRRPDVIAARAQVDQYAARLGVARKDWLPSLSVEASAGTQATRFDDLFSKGSFYWQVAPKISWTVFEGLSRKYNNAELALELEAAMDSYNQTVLTAWNEVANARDQYLSAMAQLECQRQLLAEAQKTFTLSVDLYKQGLVVFSNVQSAQVSWLDARDTILTTHYDALAALVTLYQTLGLSGDSTD